MTALLITGAGLLGSAVAKAMASAYEVTVVDRDPRSRSNLPHRVAFEQCCVTDRGRMAQLIESRRPDAIVHTAAMLGPSFKADPKTGHRVNVAATIALADSARAGGVRRFVQASTLAVYDFSCPASDLAENAGKCSNDIYGVAKLDVEAALHERCNQGTSVAVLRFAGLYGPVGEGNGGWSARALWSAACSLASGTAVTLDGDRFGDNEYLHADDAARAIALAVRTDEPLLCNIGAGTITRLHELANAFRMAAPNVHVDTSPISAAAPDYLRRRCPLEIGLARTRLGYAPEIGIDDGIAGLVAAAHRIAARTGSPAT
jgi:UDP-glucose 4-epimerase